MTFRTQFETEVDRVDLLMKQIADQNEVVAHTSGALAKLFAGDLQSYPRQVI